MLKPAPFLMKGSRPRCCRLSHRKTYAARRDWELCYSRHIEDLHQCQTLNDFLRLCCLIELPTQNTPRVLCNLHTVHAPVDVQCNSHLLCEPHTHSVVRPARVTRLGNIIIENRGRDTCNCISFIGDQKDADYSSSIATWCGARFLKPALTNCTRFSCSDHHRLLTF